jgi:hypothetical protein
MALASQGAFAQATITGPSTWQAGQPATVTWTVQRASTCASGVRVVLNLGTTQIQTGNAVPLSMGSTVIPGSTLSAGTAVSLTLKDMCTGNIVSAAHPISIVGGGGGPVAVAPVAGTTITPQVRQNIDTACMGVLGQACSTTSGLSSTYTAITQQIQQNRLASDSASVMYNYLIPMVKSSTSWQSAVISNAWASTGCAGIAPQSQWMSKYGQWTTYQQLSNSMRSAGCAGASANVPTAQPTTQYLSAQQMSPGYSAVWGPAAGYATISQNCPINVGAVSCARSDLAAYVKSKGTGILQTLEAPNYQAVTGQQLDAAHAQTITKAFGVNWSGADDLSNYLKANPNLFPQTVVWAGLDANGCPVNASGGFLAAQEQCHLLFISSTGVHSTGQSSVNLNGTIVPASGFSPSSLLVDSKGAPVVASSTATGFMLSTANGIVAQGGGNIVAQGGGNIVAQGGGNIVAQGGGNIVAQGGGNIVAQGGGNFTSINFAAMSPLLAARATGLIDSNGASILNQNGTGLLPSLLLMPSISSLIGNSGSTLISNNPNQFVGQNGSALASSTGNYGTMSVSSAPMAVITGPTAWTSGQPAMIAWNVSPNAQACAAGYQVLVNGNTLAGPIVAITSGKSLVPGALWQKGTYTTVALESLCTKAPVSAPYQIKIQ